MNTDTRIAICCHATDQNRVADKLGDVYLHHKCPVVILSPETPEEARANIEFSGAEIRFGGPNGYIGQEAIARHRRYLEILLTFPEKFFFLNESDSFCLSQPFPDYLYAEPNVVWSNLSPPDPDTTPNRYPGDPRQVVSWAPWFLSRDSIQSLLSVADNYQVEPDFSMTGSIDYYMSELARLAQLPEKGFPIEQVFPHEGLGVYDAVRNHGVVFVHSVKRVEDARILVELHDLYVRNHP